MTEANAPAYPVETNPEEHGMHSGLTKREYFAGLAMSGYLACDHMGNTGQMPSYLAKLSVDMADALIAELSKPQP